MGVVLIDEVTMTTGKAPTAIVAADAPKRTTSGGGLGWGWFSALHSGAVLVIDGRAAMRSNHAASPGADPRHPTSDNRKSI